MSKISKHPVLDVPVREKVIFKYNGQEIEGEKGYTIAAALHQAGFPVHGHSLEGRQRSLECGIGKCGACEMLVDGKIRRICITKVDDVKEVCELTGNFMARKGKTAQADKKKILRTTVVIVGGGMAGSSLFRYMAEAGMNPVLVNADRGSSWRNIGGGRTAFSLPELAEIAAKNQELFKELQTLSNIDYKPIRYKCLPNGFRIWRE